MCPAQRPEAWGRSVQPRTSLCQGSCLLPTCSAQPRQVNKQVTESSQGGVGGRGRYWWGWSGGWLLEQEEGPQLGKSSQRRRGTAGVRGQMWGGAAQAVRRGSGGGSGDSLQRTRGEEGFPSGSVVKNPPANAGDVSLILGLGRSPGEENGNPLQYPCLGNPMDRGAWWATVHGVAESDTMQ